MSVNNITGDTEHHLSCIYFTIYIWNYYPFYYKTLCEQCFDHIHEETRGFHKIYKMEVEHEELTTQEIHNNTSKIINVVCEICNKQLTEDKTRMNCRFCK